MENLVYLYSHVDLILIIFCRITAAIAFLPIIEESKMPRMAVMGIGLCLSATVFFVTDCSKVYYSPTLIAYTIVLIRETMVGLIIGFSFKILFQVYQFVGSLLSTQGGLGMSMTMDPVGGTQSPIIGRFYNLGLCAFFVLTGGYHWFIKSLVESFKLIPINQSFMGPNIVWIVIDATSNYMLVAFKLAIPILSIIILVDFGMGILARTVPQMNMFVVGIPIKMIILFVLLMVTINLASKFNDIIIENLVETMINLIQGMRPI